MNKNKIRGKSLLPNSSTEWGRLARMKAVALLAVGLLAVPTTASSAMVLLDFEDVGDLIRVENFYGGDGITFSADALSLEQVLPVGGGSGNFVPYVGNSGTAIMILAPGNSATLTSTVGFTALSFYFTASSDGSVDVFDSNGGSLLPEPQTLSAQAQLCMDYAFCDWSLVSVLFSGTATSVVFSGVAESIGFDDIALTTPAAPVPLPAAAWLLLSGLAGLGFVGRRRTNK